MSKIKGYNKYPVPFFTIGNSELAANEDLSECEPCPKCECMCKVKQANQVLEDGTRKPSDSYFITCDECGEMYLVGIRGKRVR